MLSNLPVTHLLLIIGILEICLYQRKNLKEIDTDKINFAFPNLFQIAFFSQGPFIILMIPLACRFTDWEKTSQSDQPEEQNK